VSVSVAASGNEAFPDCFERCELPEAEWTHQAHGRVAWVCLSIMPPDEALQRIRKRILSYSTDVLHRRNKYHETVTVASTRIVAARIRAGEKCPDFARRIDDLLNAEMPLLLRYYSKDRLSSDAPREAFQEPDLEDTPSLTEILKGFKNG